MKIGKTPNVSQLPVATCPKGVPCSQRCYACKATRTYNTALRKWFNNTCLWRSDPKEFEKQVFVYIEKRRPKFFRWSVAGDIPDPEYFRMILRTACRFPDTKFYVPTKYYDLFLTSKGDTIVTREDWGVPANLTLLISRWGHYEKGKVDLLMTAFPVANVQLKDDAAASDDHGLKVRKCPGKCDKCRICWGKIKVGECVEFKEH